jgi:hypothetical protein
MKHSYLRINADGDIPMDFINLADDVPKLEVWNELKKLCSHYDADMGERSIYFGTNKYSLWCSDGKRYNVEILYDEEGVSKKLVPNHRMNAMVDAGRFTSKKFDYIGKSRNQEIKECWGSNYFVGDVIIKVVTGKPIPDCSIFGDNPLDFILQGHIPNRRMINKYGHETLHMFWATSTKVMNDKFFSDPDWKDTEYWLLPTREVDSEYIDLLKSWGYCSSGVIAK